MKRLFLLAGLPVLLLMTIGGLAAWDYAHLRYPNLVHYERLALTDSSPYWSFGKSTVIQEWIDPRLNRQRICIDGLAHPVDRVLRDGRVYDNNPAARDLLSGSLMEQWFGWLLQQGCAGTRELPSLPAAGHQGQLDIGSGYTATVICARTRLTPGALPAGFFDPPHRSLWPWDQLQGWLGEHVGSHQN